MAKDEFGVYLKDIKELIERPPANILLIRYIRNILKQDFAPT